MVQVKRRRGESTESLLRRFRRYIQKSKLFEHARESMFYEKPKSKREMRKAARERAKYREQQEKLRKMTKFDSQDLGKFKPH